MGGSARQGGSNTTSRRTVHVIREDGRTHRVAEHLADFERFLEDKGNTPKQRRRQDLQPIRPDLAELLRAWLTGRPAGVPVFGRLPGGTARMLRTDLEAARAQWIDEAKTDDERQRRERSDFLRYANAAGGVADFHGATRHGYISAIVAGKASVKTAQELARHSTPVLTIGRYSHARLHDLTGALEALPDLTPQKPTLEVLRATGTDGKSRLSVQDAQRLAQRAVRETVQTLSNGCDGSEDGQETEPASKPLQVAGLDAVARPGAMEREERRRWELNPRWRICNLTANPGKHGENAVPRHPASKSPARTAVWMQICRP
jgi:hypothetical protein